MRRRGMRVERALSLPDLDEREMVRGHPMCVRGLLVPPRLENGKMTWPADLLDKLQAHVAVVFAARVTVLLERRHRRPPGCRDHVNIRHNMDAGVRGLSGDSRRGE